MRNFHPHFLLSEYIMLQYFLVVHAHTEIQYVHKCNIILPKIPQKIFQEDLRRLISDKYPSM